MNLKRRKTAEERKSPNMIEYSKKAHDSSHDKKPICIWNNMTIQQLANSLQCRIEDVQEAILLIRNSESINPNTRLEGIRLIQEVVAKCGSKSCIVAAPDTPVIVESKDRDVAPRPPAPPHLLQPRPPVITVMGHVDHGKTTLLDSLRGANVAHHEAGSITQHIGAFTVSLDNNEKMTFLDTPGHAAFSAMRARGAHLTDIIVLVVAAEDGVMKQTLEVVKLARDHNVPIIVAINKIDKPGADVVKVKKELAKVGLISEDMGGDVQMVAISALKGTNLRELAEAISVQAALMGLQADYTGLVEGIVVESRTDARRGKLSTAIVTRGTLRKGMILVSGLAHAKVRAIFDHNGQPLYKAEPGTPIQILGWRELPLSGDTILEVESDKKAHAVLRWREHQAQKEKANLIVEDIRQKEEEHLKKYHEEREARRKMGRFRWQHGPRPKESLPEDDVPRVSVILKADVHGSVEAILDVFESYDSNELCRLDVVHYGVGNVSEGDIELAKVFNAIIYAFGVEVTPPQPPKDVNIRQYNVIYRLIENLKEEINAKLPPREVEDVHGEAEVLKQFKIREGRKDVPVAGCRCIRGVLKKAKKFRLVRDDEVIYEGALESMRHIKDEVDTIKKDVECGLRLKDTEIVPEPGDKIICYSVNTKKQKTDWDPGF